jgi:hypothetical protein
MPSGRVIHGIGCCCRNLRPPSPRLRSPHKIGLIEPAPMPPLLPCAGPLVNQIFTFSTPPPCFAVCSLSGRWGVRVQFYHREKFRLRGPNQLEVVVSIYFSEFEEAIIETGDLKYLAVVERMPTIFKDFYDEWRQIDNNIYLGKFLSRTHAEPVASPTHAQAFEHEMLLALEHVKSIFSCDEIASQKEMREQREPPTSRQQFYSVKQT